MTSPRVECYKNSDVLWSSYLGFPTWSFPFSHFQAGGKKVAATEIMDFRYIYSNFQKKREMFLSNAFLSPKLSQKPTFSTSTAI